jgi:hypothetical protein
MEVNQTFRYCQTLNFASNDQKLKIRIENWCKENNKNLFHCEPKSPDLFDIDSFAIIADPEFVGKENMINLVEYHKSTEFNESIYEDEEVVNFYKQYFNLDENGKFIQEPTKLLVANELNADEIISKLDKFKEIYQNRVPYDQVRNTVNTIRRNSILKDFKLKCEVY